MRFVYFILLVCFGQFASGQFIEFGGGVGFMNYSGDISRSPFGSSTNLAFTGIYRMNLSPVLSMKVAATTGSVAANDQSPGDALAEERNWNFKYSLFEISSVFEYHFIDYRNSKLRTHWSPFAFMGVGITRVNNQDYTYEEFNPLQLVIPMGGGVKYILGKQFTLGVEIGARKTFFDYLDGVSDGDPYIKDFQYGNPTDTDWYFFTGFNLTYVLYKVKCPFPYVPNKSMLIRVRPN